MNGPEKKDRRILAILVIVHLIWSSLKRMLNEPHSEQYVFDKLAYYKKNNLNPANYMKLIPVPFSTQGAKMLQHTKSLIEDSDNLIVIDRRFDKLKQR